ncbi:MAG: hypothetical protein HY863_18410 [Chloroflexi bacterium]|nr:hypothetical protein [Chloroflexota bacterium]
MTLSSPLVQAFNDHPSGLCRQREPARVIGNLEDIEQRLNLLAFGVVVDTKHINVERWSALAEAHDHWLFQPSQAAYKTSPQVLAGMQQLHLVAPQYIARVWWQICRGVQGRTKGSWRDLFRGNDDDAQLLQKYLHKNQTTFPVLSGPVISARWLDLVHRVGGVLLKNWETLSVPLPEKQRKAARLFGVVTDEVHPIFSSALNVWENSCQKLPAESCGLAKCPPR